MLYEILHKISYLFSAVQKAVDVEFNIGNLLVRNADVLQAWQLCRIIYYPLRM